MQLTAPRKAALTTIATLGLVGALFTPAAGAESRADEAPGLAMRDDAGQVHGTGADGDGDADRDRATSYTEDDDTNDGGTRNNVVDDGDNRHPSGKDRSVERGNGGNQGRSESDPDNDTKGPERNSGGPDKPNGSGGVDQANQDGNNGCGNDDDFEDDNEGWCGKPTAAVETPKTTPTTQKPAQANTGGKRSNKPATSDTPCPKGGGKDEGMGKGCGHSCAKAGGHETGNGQGHTEACATSGVQTATCPAGTVDTNGAMAGGCATVGGAVLGNAAEADTDDDGEYVGGAPEGEVLSNTADRPAAAELPATAETVRAASASGATAFRVGALAFTGAGISILMAVALGLLLVGFVLVRSSRRRAEVAS